MATEKPVLFSPGVAGQAVTLYSYVSAAGAYYSIMSLNSVNDLI
ncbi:MAG TPA: hypothetical protein VJ963_13170 [Bacteroidales bacterium]|nr:hypothetical protein [Bacteroidales bacterium]